MFTNHYPGKKLNTANNESLSSKIQKQKEKNAALRKKIEDRDKQIAANKKKIADLEHKKKEREENSKPSQSFTLLLKQIKGNK